MEKQSRQVADRPLPEDFDSYLPWACFQLSVDATVIITRTFQSNLRTSADRQKNKASGKCKVASETLSDPESLTGGGGIGSGFTKGINMLQKPIYIETTYNDFLHLVQIKFLKNTEIPRTVMKIIGFLLPYQKTLTTLVINSGLSAGVIHEIERFLPTTNITEVCLDGTTLVEANYHILLNKGILKYLSLSRCKINDAVVKNIAAKLIPPCAASKSLSALNLATNRITDVGADHIANLLRYNRHLTYLNLSDNMITDDGVSKIFDMLLEFPLTDRETVERNKNRMKYLRAKKQLILKNIQGVQMDDFEKKSKRKATKPALSKKKEKVHSLSTIGRSLTDIEQHHWDKAGVIAEGILGPFDDPFGADHTETRENKVYCFGNNKLAYLNLAYNNLTYSSLKRLRDVVMTQNILRRNPHGLINVRIEGNYLPEACTELEMIDNILEAGLASYKRPSEVNKKKVVSSKNSSKPS
nr:leucine-rich repeat-containing protein 71 [Helicoverpa armigera]